ncbi:MAG TPA: hypothetical protein VJ781_00240 [Pyrinomonadaceae bacterium]|nr:hypothetical protein [Pyrinomonadaceae bacterium]
MGSVVITRLVLSAFSIALLFLAAPVVYAQSTLPDFPTPISTNELSGAIRPRDIGDSRLTTYYYWFEGSQGDVFVNLMTKNFAGDVDVFLQNGLRPLTKVVVYPDFGEVETGRVIYLRKPEKLLLRIQGRTPNDEPALFRVKFAGSFVAVSGGATEPEVPKVIGETVGSVKVNSIGTIVPPPPKSVRDETETPVAAADTSTAKEVEPREKPKSETETESARVESESKSASKVEVVITDSIREPIAEASAKTTTPPRRTRNAKVALPKKISTPPPDAVSGIEEKKETEVDSVKEETKSTESKVDPLANVQLIILFKDGRKIERPILEVARFSVDRGVLTVIAKGGRIGRYSMVDVEKVTIQ